MNRARQAAIAKSIFIVLILYVFMLSIKLLGHSFKLFGAGFAEAVIEMTSNPFVGLLAGIVSTSLIQSSSTTTSIVVGLVAGGALSLTNAIPIIMGANIGTTITNVLVSVGHITRRVEFRRAFSASIVHDFFNLCAVLVLFPLELKFRLIERVVTALEQHFASSGGLKVFNPLKLIMDPLIAQLDRLFSSIPFYHIILAVTALFLMFGSLTLMIKTIRSLVIGKLEVIVQNYLFRNDLSGFVLGILITVVVQSSSITTSLVVPLAGAGLVSVRQIFPYTLGVNVGTTITAILASLATQNEVAVAVAFSHLCFNVFAILIFYPLKFIPIRLAIFVGDRATRSTKNMILFVGLFFLQYIIPALFIFLL